MSWERSGAPHLSDAENSEVGGDSAQDGLWVYSQLVRISFSP